MLDSPYSPLKIFHHQDRIDSLRNGEHPVLLHVQLIPTNLCNHDCSFCLAEGTKIHTVDGLRNIETVHLDDSVFGHTGQLCKVRQVSSRMVNELYRIEVGGKDLFITEEHPLLTLNGWKPVKELVENHSYISRVDYDHSGFNRMGDKYWNPLKRKDKISKQCTVYNLSCSPDESYVANGIVVHNCAYRMHGYSSSEDFEEKDQIPFGKIKEIVEDCAKLNVRAIEITGGGEPTIYPKFVDLCEVIRNNGIDYAVVSNGASLNRSKLDALLKAKWVRFSIDAGQEDTYANIRDISKDQYFRTRYNIRSLVELRNKSNTDLLIGEGFVVTKENWQEVLLAAQNAKEDGVDNFRISAIFQNEGAKYFEGFYQDAKELCHETQKLQTNDFRVFNMFGERMSDLVQQFPDYSFCGYQHFVTYIGGDQNVYRCCNTAYNPRGFLGSVREKSFYDVWMEARDKLEDFDARRCPRCMFNTKNRRIAYALDSSPSHVNFL